MHKAFKNIALAFVLSWAFCSAMPAQAQELPAFLELTKTVSGTTFEINELITYTLTVENSGFLAASNVVVTDVLPAGLTLIAATSSVAVITTNGTTLTMNFGTLDIDEINTAVVTMWAQQPGRQTNVATIATSTSNAVVISEDQVSVVHVLSDLRLAKTDSADPVMRETPYSYLIIASNAGPAAITNLVVLDTLPVGLSLLQATTTLGDLTITGQTVQVAVSSLETDAVVQVTLVVLSTNGAEYVNTATAAGLADGTNTLLETASQTTVVGGAVRGDLDGDGFGDLVVFNDDDNSHEFFFMQQGALLDSAFLLGEAVDISPWQLVGGSDLNDDGTEDLIFKYGSENMQAVAFMHAGQVTNSAFITYGGASNTSPWHAVAGGDLNGDGRGDVIFRYDNSGYYAVAYMNGGEITNSAFLFGEDFDVSPWKVIAAGDVDGNGRAEVIGQYDNDGLYAVGFFAEDGVTLTNSQFLLGEQIDISPWRLVAVSDIYGDGKADLIFRFGEDYLFDIVQMDGVMVTNSQYLLEGDLDEPLRVIGPR